MRKVFLVLASLLLLSACSKKHSKGHSIIKGFTMGTTYSIKIYPEQLPKDLTKLKVEINSILSKINSRMSTYLKESELSKLNMDNAKRSIKVSSELYKIIRRSLEVSRETKGAFDVTVGPLVNLWGFGPTGKRRDVPPKNFEIQKLKELIGYDKLKMQGLDMSIIKLHAKSYVDLSAIAKGYGVDQVSKLLTSRGQTDHMVEIGGEIRVQGYKNPLLKKRWKIAIETPRSNKREMGRIVGLSDISMATSGDYRNFFTYKGRRYSHTIDPRTGHPITHKLTSVTVLHKECMDADAYATALMVMGEIEGVKWANDVKLLAIFYLKQSNGKFKEIISRKMSEYLKEQL